MRRTGILNIELSTAISRLGHTDTFVVADCGLPVPPGVPLIDLAVIRGLPEFRPVLGAILAETVIEKALFAAEAADTKIGEFLVDRLPMATTVTHDELKRLCADARFIVRTGEATPYANVVLQAGVSFS